MRISHLSHFTDEKNEPQRRDGWMRLYKFGLVCVCKAGQGDVCLVCHGNLYYFPAAAVTNDHKSGGLKRNECIILQFWMRKSKNQGVSSMHFFWRLWGGESAPLLLIRF